MLNTQLSIIYFGQTDKELLFSFHNIGSEFEIVYYNDEQFGIEPSIVYSFQKTILAGETVIANASNGNIDYSITDNGVDITPTQILIPSINIDTLIERKEKLESALQYLAVNVSTANYSNFVTTNRNSITDYERGLDTLQTAITASAASYLNGANVQRKSDLINILN